MSRLIQAKEILKAIGLPAQQQNERSAFTLLALAQIGPKTPWTKAQKPLLRIWDIMSYMRETYSKDYAANSRETIRRQTIHQFEQARIVDRNVDDPIRPTNSGRTVYCLTNEILEVLKSFGTPGFSKSVTNFTDKAGLLKVKYNERLSGLQIPFYVREADTPLTLSPGKHNELQIAVLDDKLPRFAPGAEVLYMGDTANKHVIFQKSVMESLHIPLTQHDKLPDIVLYHKGKNWLFLVEAVTTHGPVSPKRHIELEKMLAKCQAARVYVSAFLGIATFRKYAADIAWETEVWIAEQPEHMIHFNGPKFVGPYVPGSTKK